MTDAGRAVEPQPARIGKDRRQLPSWRWEELRTTFWVVPSVLVVVSVVNGLLFGWERRLRQRRGIS